MKDPGSIYLTVCIFFFFFERGKDGTVAFLVNIFDTSFTFRIDVDKKVETFLPIASD